MSGETTETSTSESTGQGTESTAEETHTAEQQEHIGDLIDGLDGKEPSTETPAGTEHNSPPGTAEAPGDGKEATAPGESETPDSTKAATETKTPAEDGDTSEETPSAEEKHLETEYQVKGPEGVRPVKARDLVTTYQQYGNLQRQHVALKPVIDLVREARVSPDQIVPILAYGLEQMRMAQTGDTGNGNTGGTPGAYSGPFESAEQDTKIKEADPTFHAMSHRMFNENRQLRDQISQLTNGFQSFQSSQATRSLEEGRQANMAVLEDKIGDFSGNHTDYFKPDPATGRSENMENFKAYLATHYGHVKINDLTPELLSNAFMAFDPAFYNAYMQQKITADQERMKQEANAAFGETGSVRTSTPAEQLTEQQEHMADLFV
ncbi:MAG: hypothetical protein HKM93_08885 [Desulfobacteraceae bacterium]|nr:hypothetical protein [Desulfobacteraceae bacterium]